MDKDNIRKMALESGICDESLSEGRGLMTDYGDAEEAVYKFAAMVAAAEREACAVICDKTAQSWANQELQWASSARDCADAIRSRE